MCAAALLAHSLYRNVAGDGRNILETVLVVLVAALGFGVSTFLGGASAGSLATGLLAGIVLEPLVTLAAWLGGSFAAWLVGARLAPAEAKSIRFWTVARVLVFAQTPNLAGVLVILPPPYTSGVWLMARLWLLAATSTAIRESLGLSGGRVLVTLAVSAAVYAALLVGIFSAIASLDVGRVTSVHGIGGL
ncbi:MAG: hypothetical protein OXR64_12640 [Chloroflexota bacterium]|nr:hypothetical protein [Chloroflexota bacterium]